MSTRRKSTLSPIVQQPGAQFYDRFVEGIKQRIRTAPKSRGGGSPVKADQPQKRNISCVQGTCFTRSSRAVKLEAMKEFTLEYWADDGWYVGRLKEMPAVMSQGETLEELQAMIRDAYRLIVEDAAESTFVPTEKNEMAISL